MSPLLTHWPKMKNQHIMWSWFPQTLKSAWIWMLSWKVLDFSVCLENGKFSLKSAWKWLYGLEKYRHQKVQLVSVLFCTFELRKVAGFSNFVIKSPSLLIQWAVFCTVQITKSIFFLCKILCRCVYNWNINSEYFNLIYGKLIYNRMTHLQYATWWFHRAWKM